MRVSQLEDKARVLFGKALCCAGTCVLQIGSPGTGIAGARSAFSLVTFFSDFRGRSFAVPSHRQPGKIAESVSRRFCSTIRQSPVLGGIAHGELCCASTNPSAGYAQRWILRSASNGSIILHR